MSAAELKELRREVKKRIDRADGRALKIVNAILDADTEDNDWWDTLPENIKADIEESLAQADRGEVMTHDEVKKRYPQWFTK